MSPLYTYRCPEGHETEMLMPFSVETTVCSCGVQAQRQSVYHFAVVGQAAVPRDERSYRQSFGEYQDAVAEVSDGYERMNRDRAPSEQIKEPDYSGLAKARAVAHGVPIRNDTL